MIFDSQEQKDFILTCVREFPIKIGQAQEVFEKFVKAINEGEIKPPIRKKK